MAGRLRWTAVLILSTLVTLGTVAWGVEGGDLEVLLSAPLERHVFQRNGDSGPIWIQGTIPGGADRVDVQVIRSGEVVLPWHSIAFGTDQFQVFETLPQGGWYSVQVRAVRGKGVAMVTVNRVGIGEVFLTAGQSNSANSGAFLFTALDTVSAWTGTEWVVANDPQPIADGNRGSTWAVMGNHLTMELGRADQSPLPIGLISVGVGHTAVRNWLPGAAPLFPRFTQPLFDRIGQQVQTFGPWCGFRAVLWHQGESDSHQDTSTEVYCDDLTTIIRTMRSLRNPSNPIPWWIIAHATTIYDPPAQIGRVLEGQTLAIQRNPPAFPGPDTNTLVPPRDRQKNDTHFNKRGQEIVGRAWAEAVLAALRESGDRSAIASAAVLEAEELTDPRLQPVPSRQARRPVAGRNGFRPGGHGSTQSAGKDQARRGDSRGSHSPSKEKERRNGSGPSHPSEPNSSKGRDPSRNDSHKRSDHGKT
jgi:hypothetical protein